MPLSSIWLFNFGALLIMYLPIPVATSYVVYNGPRSVAGMYLNAP